ncbi:hypothetical protein F5Y17DRAFT_264383 [Xylariaceae sp. FL0594]|nr:hypothetical protein F5Y17DRAFT_264383 [Xylariaceae sp. FL0594]
MSKYEALRADEGLLTKGQREDSASLASEDVEALKTSYARSWFSRVNPLAVYSVVSTVLIVLLTGALLSQSDESSSETCSRPASCIDRPYKLQFGSNDTYTSIDHKYDHLWGDDSMENLLVKIPDHYGAPATPGVISMFHQLHCLSSLRTAIQMASEGKDAIHDGHISRHWPHCLNYLRNTLLCNADGVIERQITIDGKLSNHIDGTQDVRQCGDAERLMGVMREQGKNVDIELLF